MVGNTRHRNNLSKEQMLIVDAKISLVNSPYTLMYLIDMFYLSYIYS